MKTLSRAEEIAEITTTPSQSLCPEISLGAGPLRKGCTLTVDGLHDPARRELRRRLHRALACLPRRKNGIGGTHTHSLTHSQSGEEGVVCSWSESVVATDEEVGCAERRKWHNHDQGSELGGFFKEGGRADSSAAAGKGASRVRGYSPRRHQRRGNSSSAAATGSSPNISSLFFHTIGRKGKSATTADNAHGPTVSSKIVLAIAGENEEVGTDKIEFTDKNGEKNWKEIQSDLDSAPKEQDS